LSEKVEQFANSHAVEVANDFPLVVHNPTLYESMMLIYPLSMHDLEWSRSRRRRMVTTTETRAVANARSDIESLIAFGSKSLSTGLCQEAASAVAHRPTHNSLRHNGLFASPFVLDVNYRFAPAELG
jgi:hypothetical protein